MVKRRQRTDCRNGSGDDKLFDEDFYSSYPGLWEFLTEPVYEDGTHRETGTLSVFKDGQTLKACLSDRDLGEVAFVSGVTFKALLDRLESGLTTDGLEWKDTRGKSNKGQRK